MDLLYDVVFVLSGDVFHCSMLLGFRQVCHTWNKNLVERFWGSELHIEISNHLRQIIAKFWRGDGTVSFVEGFSPFLSIDASDPTDHFEAAWYSRIGPLPCFSHLISQSTCNYSAYHWTTFKTETLYALSSSLGIWTVPLDYAAC